MASKEKHSFLYLNQEKLEQYKKEFGIGIGYMESGTYGWQWAQKWADYIFTFKVSKDNIDLWQFFEFFIKDTVPMLPYWGFADILYKIDLYHYIFKKERPAIVLTLGLDECDEFILSQMGSYYGFELDSRWITKQKSNSFLASSYIKTRIYWRLLRNLKFNDKHNDFLIITNDRHSLKNTEDDLFYGSIIKEFNAQSKHPKVIEYDRIYNRSNIFKKIYTHDKNYIGSYYTLKSIKKIFSLAKEIKSLKQKINNPYVSRTLKYHNIDFYEIAKPRLDYCFDVMSYYVADLLVSAEEVIKAEMPKVVIVEHEKNFFDKAIIFYAKKHGIKSVCFEGELIYEKNTYGCNMHNKRLILPDIKFCWSKYSKNWWNKNGKYPNSILNVVGNHKLDGIIRKKPTNKPIKNVLISISAIPWEQKIMDYSLKALEGKDVNIIFKVHPDGCKTKIPAKKNIKVVQHINTNIYELINWADLVLTYESTLCWDILASNTPMIILNFIDDALYMPYSNIAPVANNLQQLKDLYAQQPKYLNTPESFLSKYFYKVDGEVSKRIVNIITKGFSDGNV